VWLALMLGGAIRHSVEWWSEGTREGSVEGGSGRLVRAEATNKRRERSIAQVLCHTLWHLRGCALPYVRHTLTRSRTLTIAHAYAHTGREEEESSRSFPFAVFFLPYFLCV